MKLLPILLALIITTTGAFAAVPAAPAPAANTPPPAKPGTPAPTTPPAPAAAPAPAILDDYITVLTTTLTLSDADKKAIHDLYTADGAALQKILNDDTLSSLQKAQQVADLRDVRNTKIDQILHDLDKQKAFSETEAVYRVSLTEFAADGGLAPTPPPAPSSAPEPAPNTTVAPPSQTPAITPAAK